ncbi:MAG: DNA repair protein RadC [Zetaproteobacteria bacterium]|nr:MAG: DNA repair protein RadC [Zetaproteobacteria bacterium]
MSDDVRGHRERLRQRFARDGLNGFHDYEVLELLLTYAIPRRDVKPLAKRLLATFGTLADVFDASIQELKSVPGMGEKGARFLALVRQAQLRYLASGMKGRSVFSTPELVRAHLRVLLQGRGMECFGAIFVDQQHRHIATEVLFEGTVDRAVVYPRNVIKRALELDAKGVILFHNHPGRTPRASGEDTHLTARMREACALLDLNLLDHFLVAGTKVLSFREEGWW